MAQISDREFLNLIHDATKRYKGNIEILEKAIGVLAVGREVGWRPLYIIHERPTLERYEGKLGIKFRESLDEVGPMADKSVGWKIAKKLSNFWKAVRGEYAGVKSPALE